MWVGFEAYMSYPHCTENVVIYYAKLRLEKEMELWLRKFQRISLTR